MGQTTDPRKTDKAAERSQTGTKPRHDDEQPGRGRRQDPDRSLATGVDTDAIQPGKTGGAHSLP